jgi:hypothetical protein
MKLTDYIKMQLAERYRSFILCGAGMTGKTDEVKKSLNELGGKYIDVLQFFSETKCADVESIRPERFFKIFQLEEDKLIALDNVDFLFGIWTENQQREFIRKIDMKSNGSCILVVLHNYRLLEESGLMKTGSKGQKRIVNIAEFD